MTYDAREDHRLSLVVFLAAFFLLALLLSSVKGTRKRRLFRDGSRAETDSRLHLFRWDTLTRSMTDCQSVGDPKSRPRLCCICRRDLPSHPAVQSMSGKCNVGIEHCRWKFIGWARSMPANFNPPGLLYLPEKYVVPGGRFNEMYGWDSYFIIRGLLESGRSIWRKEWSTTSFSKLSITAPCSTRTGRTI